MGCLPLPRGYIHVHNHYFQTSSSLKPHGQSSPIVYGQVSVVRRRRPSTKNVFSSETAWPIKANFYVEPPWERGTKVYMNGPGHMTKMAAMPIYGKNLKKSSSQELEVLLSGNLVCIIGDSSSTNFI